MNHRVISVVLALIIAVSAAMISAPVTTASYNDAERGEMRIGITSDPAKFPQPVTAEVQPDEETAFTLEEVVQ